jgi:membrane-bound lytic murein transglycosylase D
MVAASRDMPAPAEASPTRHEVQKGDTLFSVARRYGLSVADLSQANPNLNGSLKAGQILRLPLSAQASGENKAIQPASFKVSLRKPAPQPVRYTVKRGDTLHAIAQRFDISLADIRSLNPDFRKHSAIHAGQRVVVSKP